MKKLLLLGLLLFASTASAQQAPQNGVKSPPPQPPQYGVKPAPFAATPYVFDTEDARKMTEAGADILVAHMGLTTSG